MIKIIVLVIRIDFIIFDVICDFMGNFVMFGCYYIGNVNVFVINILSVF